MGSYHKCLGYHSGNSDYISYDQMLALARIQKAPAFLKMDVEGFEWSIIPGMLAAARPLPLQIGFELHQHARASTGFGWKRIRKPIEDMALFGEMLYRAGYLVLHRRDNNHGDESEAAEFLIARAFLPQE